MEQSIIGLIKTPIWGPGAEPPLSLLWLPPLSRKSELKIAAPVLPVGELIPRPAQYAPLLPVPSALHVHFAFWLESRSEEFKPSVVQLPNPLENVEFGSVGPPHNVV